jgi:hypothetical protein
LVKFGSLLQKQLATLPEDMHLIMACIAAVKNHCQRVGCLLEPTRVTLSLYSLCLLG